MNNEESAEKAPLDMQGRGYSEEEINNIYALGRLFLENGDSRRAMLVFHGLTEVATDFVPAWLGLATISLEEGEFDGSIQALYKALEFDAESNVAMLLLVSCLISVGDYTRAGTYLGELGDRIESWDLNSFAEKQFYNAQLARYQSR